MLWLDKHKRVWRLALLVLLIVAIMGPWTFERINVPSKYPCSPPFIRLEGDFCGEPMSGIWIFSLMIYGMISSSLAFVTGGIVFISWVRQLIFSSFLILLLLPIFTTILLIRTRDSRRWRISHLIAWGLAGAVGAVVLLLDLSNFSRQFWMLWGAWLFIGLVICALILEMLTLAARRRFNQENLYPD